MLNRYLGDWHGGPKRRSCARDTPPPPSFGMINKPKAGSVGGGWRGQGSPRILWGQKRTLPTQRCLNVSMLNLLSINATFRTFTETEQCPLTGLSCPCWLMIGQYQPIIVTSDPIASKFQNHKRNKFWNRWGKFFFKNGKLWFLVIFSYFSALWCVRVVFIQVTW